MIYFSNDREFSPLIGGKAAALAKLNKEWCRIPAWFVVPDGESPDELEITEACDRIGMTECQFAVRSSAVGEDGEDHSFAGQYDSFLNVSKNDVFTRISDVHRSGESAHLQTYQGSKEIAEVKRPAALVQCMLAPDVSGVAFSADPVSGDRSVCLVSSVWGLGSALVSGEADADLWKVGDDWEILDEQLAKKEFYHRVDLSAREGVSLDRVDDHRIDIASLNSDQVVQVAKLVKDCERHFGCPQDIEWAFQEGVLFLLQSRPITNLPEPEDKSQPLTVWDNSNIAESYSGVTSPLTFSFAERIYEHAYREFCRLFSVPDEVIEKHDAVFAKMLGHVRGHVYYNLNSWYRVLAMLPGFSLNRGFMEQMMGVKMPMPEEVVDQIVKETRRGKVDDLSALIGTLKGLVRNHRHLPSQIVHFQRRLNTALSSNSKPLEQMTGKELVDHYSNLEAQLLKRWDAPLVNDFFAMIYCGVLGALCGKWLDDSSLQGELLINSGDIISAEPPRRIKVMGKIAANDPELVRRLNDPRLEEVEKLDAIKGNSELNAEFQRYLEDFGDRCLEELKLESPSVADDSHSLVASIGAMALKVAKGGLQPDELPAADNAIDPGAKLGPLKAKIFRWVTEQARLRVVHRENLRFERTRLFGRVRMIVRQLGRRLVSEGRLREVEEVFFLRLEEVMSAFERGDERDLLALVDERRAYEDSLGTPPPDRFETRGEFGRNSTLREVLIAINDSDAELKGTGACPGIVRGPVRVISDPRQASLQEGEILVAQQTDPGWVVLFPAASGLLVERGSLLSHSAIVSRELQLPCIVSIPQVTQRLKTGNWVEMNGSTGEIHLIEQES